MSRALFVRLLSAGCALLLSACGGCGGGGGPSSPPTISSFSASAPKVQAGEKVTLSWSVSNADELAISPSIGNVTGKTFIEATVSASTTYTLTAKNAAGQNTAAVTVDVFAGPSGLVLEGLPASTTANTELTFSLRAVLPGGATASAYTGTVAFSNSDAQAVVPGAYTFTAADQGSHSFKLTLKTRGTQTLTAQDTQTPALSATAQVVVASGTGHTLTLMSGDAQSAPVTTALPAPLVVRVTDVSGAPVEGATVTFAGATGNGTVNPTQALTDASGLARTTATVSTRTGLHTFVASAAVVTGSPVTFTANATAGAATQLIKVSGDGQNGQAGVGLAQPLVVRVADAQGNGVQGFRVDWAVASGGGAVSATFVNTDSDGLARVNASLGAALGANSYRATATGLTGSPQTFTATGSSGPAAKLVYVSGNGQSGPVASALPQPFVVRATDINNNPAAGVTVTFTVQSGGGAVASAQVVTAANGQAATNATLGPTLGTQSFAVSATGLAGSPLTFTATATPGAPASIVKVSGDGQSAPAGGTLAQPFVVRVTDAGGNPAAGVTVTWTAVTGGSVPASSLTDASGLASATGTLGAAVVLYTFQAKVGALPAVSFTASAQKAATVLVYTDPPAGAKLRLVRNVAASTATSVRLDLVATVALTGYSVGLNLPVDATRIRLAATGMIPGTALNPGTAPVAAKAVLPVSGPLKGVVVSGQTQKATGPGAVLTDSAIPAGTVLYSVVLELPPGTLTGLAFDGTTQANLGPKFRAALRNRAGTDVVLQSDFAIGRLELQ